MFEAYKIGVTLSLTNHVSKGLLLMAGDFAKTEAQAAALQKRIQGIQNMALKGGLMLGAGVGILAMFKGPLDEAKKFEQQMGKFKLFGMSDAQNAEAQSFARNMNIMGSSARENLKIMTEAQGIFRESGMTGSRALEGAKLAAPYLAKINFASSALDPESAAKMKHSGVAMMRFVEMSGGLDPKKFKELANMGFKLTQTSGGAIDWEQMRQFKARSGIAGQYITEEGMAMLEPIIGELKGSTAGFAKRTAFNRLNGIIKIPNQAAQALLSAGIWDAAKVTLNSQGGIKSFSGNPLKDSALMMKSPVEFYEKNFKPMYDKANMSPEERGRNNAMYFGSTGGMLYTLIDKQMKTSHHSLDSYRKAKGIDESYSMAGKTLAGKEIDLHAKWKNLMLELGTTVLPLAVKGLEVLIPAIKSLSGWVDRNHGAVKLLAGAFVVLGMGLAINGSVLLLTAAFRGLGIALLFGAVGGASGIVTLGATLLRFGSGLAGIAAAVMTNPMVLGVLAAGAAGVGTGLLINKGLNAISGGSFGGAIYDATHPDPVNTAKKQAVIVEHTSILDGQVLAKSVTAHMAKSVSGAQASGGRMDKTMMPYRPGMATR